MNKLLITGLIGKLHPVVVHLPIGILFIGILLHVVALKKDKLQWMPVIRIIAVTGVLAVVISIFTGLILSEGDDYDSALVSNHKWSGFVLLLISVAWVFSLFRQMRTSIQLAFSCTSFLAMVVTGHLGGSLTHGDDFLSSALTEEAETPRPIIENVQEADAYNDLIQPIMSARCYSCHGRKKQKGGLRLDSYEAILKGGEDGNVVISGNTEKSELYQRLLLPITDDDHMPPKPRLQLTNSEIELIHWWIEKGLPVEKRVKDIQQSEQERQLLTSFQSSANPAAASEIPTDPVSEADPQVISELRRKNISVLPVAENSNYLQVSFISSSVVSQNDIQLLGKLSKQVVYLKMSGLPVTDEHLETIGRINALVRLHLDGSNISDSGLVRLRELANLKYLNLVNTRISEKGLAHLSALPALRSLYVYETNIDIRSLPDLRRLMPNVTIDTGGYHVPLFPEDTIRLK